MTRLLRGEVSAAKSDLEEAVSQQGGTADAETLGAMTVAAGLSQAKQNEVDAQQLWRYVSPLFRSLPYLLYTHIVNYLVNTLRTRWLLILRKSRHCSMSWRPGSRSLLLLSLRRNLLVYLELWILPFVGFFSENMSEGAHLPW